MGGKEGRKEEKKVEELIEEEIVTVVGMSHQEMPKRVLKQPVQQNKTIHQEDVVVTQVEECVAAANIEEDINPGRESEDDEYDLYQPPICGGIPLKIALDNARRPFTPPFSQLFKMSQSKQDKPERKYNPTTGKKEYIYDTKLNCYYDPDTKEYFELKV